MVFGRLGRGLLLTAQTIGKFTLFILSIISSIFSNPFYYKNLFKELFYIGFLSIPLIALTSFSSGAVLALQSYNGFARFSAESSIPTVVILSFTRELGPVLSGLMMSGRIGASITAEISTMKVKEQLDALYTLSTDPVKYLVVPRVIATTIALPFLVLIADIIGVFGGMVVSIYKLGFNHNIYIINSFKHLIASDVYIGLFKAMCFGFVISSTSCYLGINTTQGAAGVGRSTTMAVVYSSILVLVFNYIITAIFL